MGRFITADAGYKSHEFNVLTEKECLTMKKRNLIIISSAIVLVISIIGLMQTFDNKKIADVNKPVDAKKPVVETVTLENAKLGKNIKVQADYADYSGSLEDMKNKAVIVVEATVAGQMQYSDMSVLSTLDIEKSFKGKKFDKVRLFQLGNIGDANVLNVGQKYILFLGKQTDGEEDTFFVTGGEQGIVNITGNIINAKDPVMRKELSKYKGKEDFLNALEQVINR